MQEDSYEAWMQRVESLTPEEHAETVKVCDAGYFRKYLVGQEGYDGSARLPTDEVKQLTFEHGMLTMEFVEGTILKITVADVVLDTTKFVPLDNDIDAAKFQLAKKKMEVKA